MCPIAGDGQRLEIGFNNRYLMEALKYAPADTVRIELNTGVSPAIIVPTGRRGQFPLHGAARAAQGQRVRRI